MPERDLALLIDAAKVAGEIALRHWRKSPKVWEKPDGQGPVSEADLEVNDALHRLLGSARPAYGWLSEETEDGPPALPPKANHPDPIDGTRSFLQGETGFSHALAVVQQGQVKAGVVYLPAQDKLYAATASGAATLNGSTIHASDPSGTSASALTGKATLSPEHWPGGVPALNRHFRSSMAWRLCLVAEGAFDAMLTLRPAWEWDIAAGWLIASRAGATITNRNGAAPSFQRRRSAQRWVIVAARTFTPI